MDSFLKLKFSSKNDASTKTNVLKKIAAPDGCKKVTDEETMRKRKQRFAGATLSDCIVPPSKKDTSEVLAKRQLRFNDMQKASKPNEDILNTLNRRKQRFGEITSTLLKSIEEKERVLKRQARFGQNNEGTKQNDEVKKFKSEQIFENVCEFSTNEKNDEKVRKLKFDQILCENACTISTAEKVTRKKPLKKITFEDGDFSLSKDNLLNGL